MPEIRERLIIIVDSSTMDVYPRMGGSAVHAALETNTPGSGNIFRHKRIAQEIEIDRFKAHYDTPGFPNRALDESDVARFCTAVEAETPDMPLRVIDRRQAA